MFRFFHRKQAGSDAAMDERRSIRIPEEIYRRMINHCLEERPLEACGILVGAVDQVLAGYATDNQHRSPVVYRVDDMQLLEVFQSVRSEKHEVIGIYHSHVQTEAVPSRTDIEQATFPEAYYLIVSLAHRRPQMRAWRIVDKQVTEHRIVVDPISPGSWRDLRAAVRGEGAPPAGRDIP